MRAAGAKVEVHPLVTLQAEAAEFREDPLGYIRWSFPWGEEGGPLEGKTLEPWQIKVATDIGEAIKSRDFNWIDPVEPVRVAIKSGHGIGKGAFAGMITCFLLDTRPESKGNVTANTGAQLTTKTWPEICKWRRMSLLADLWEISESKAGMYIRHKHFKSAWKVDGLTWQEQRAQAFAGSHARDSSSWYIFDEDSEIPEGIHTVAKGGQTDGEPFEIRLGNPTHPTGPFTECFRKFRHRFLCYTVDSRDVSFTNKTLFAQWVEDYGEDSDFVRVRVSGKFPRSGPKQFIPHDLVREAMSREATCLSVDPLILGVDLAAEGGDEFVFCPRKGLDARSIPWKADREMKPMRVASWVLDQANALTRTGLKVRMMFADGGGLGGPIVDRIRQLGYANIQGVVNSKLKNSRDYQKKFDQCWSRMRSWLEAGGAIPDDEILFDQLTNREYDWDAENRLIMEPKKVMAIRGIGSPDRAEALALTFAEHVAPDLTTTEQERIQYADGGADYRPYE